MKKIFALAAVSMMLAATTAFATCPIKAQNTACSINTNRISHIQTPYVAPVTQRAYMPCCGNNLKKVEKKSIMQKVFTPVRGVYDATFGAIFNNLY